jgi:alpha-mannosidase
LLEENHGVAILNDCKYGISVLDNDMKLTLLKSALAPDPTADRGIHKFTYSLYYWIGSFMDCRIVQEGYELNSPVIIRPGIAGERSVFQVDSSNIIIETVKPAEDGSPDIIVRLYESKRARTHCLFTTSLSVRKISQTDMLERFQNEVELNKGTIQLDFRPFEIKTLRLNLDEK